MSPGRQWIVDGMNVLGSRPDGWWRDRPEAQARLVDQLADLVRSDEAALVTVVFDGARRDEEVVHGAQSGISVVFAPGGPGAADARIVELARQLEEPGSAVVVTSDGALAAAVRGLGVHVVGSGSFRTLLDGLVVRSVRGLREDDDDRGRREGSAG